MYPSDVPLRHDPLQSHHIAVTFGTISGWCGIGRHLDTPTSRGYWRCRLSPPSGAPLLPRSQSPALPQFPSGSTREEVSRRRRSTAAGHRRGRRRWCRAQEDGEHRSSVPRRAERRRSPPEERRRRRHEDRPSSGVPAARRGRRRRAAMATGAPRRDRRALSILITIGPEHKQIDGGQRSQRPRAPWARPRPRQDEP